MPDSTAHRISRELRLARQAYGRRLGRFLDHSAYLARHRDPAVIDLAFGDPKEPPSGELVQTLQDTLVPRDATWFGYRRDYEPAQQSIAAELTAELGVSFDAADVALTNGAFAALSTALRTVCATGDEVVFVEPSWFYYEPMIAATGGTPRAIGIDPATWLPDLDRLAATLTQDTAAVVLNSPNNPTGMVYDAALLAQLAAVLTEASERFGRPVYLVSDEAYRHVVFDGRDCPSPAAYYPFTIVVQTYTKKLLLPGERIGYLALPSSMPDRAALRDSLTVAQLVGGWGFPNNSLMYAVPELERFTLPVPPVQRNRDFLATALTEAGFPVRVPHGTFYCLARTPTDDDWAHAEHLADHGVLVLPASVMGMPGYVRVAMLGTPELLELAVTRWRDAYPTNEPVGLASHVAG